MFSMIFPSVIICFLALVCPARFENTHFKTEDYDGMRYTIVESNMNWWEAKAFCTKSGHGTLATFPTERHWNWMYQRMNWGSRLWTGFNDIAEEGKWVWNDGSNAVFRGWAIGQPNNDGNEDCMELHKEQDGIQGANDADCNIKLHSICSTTAYTTEFFEGVKYTFMNLKLSWPDAQKYCSSAKLGYLATFPTSRHWNWIFSKLTLNSEVWTGYHDILNEGRWVWDGSFTFPFNNWARGHPARSIGNEDCMLMEKTVSIEGGVSAECSRTLNFYCSSVNVDLYELNSIKHNNGFPSRIGFSKYLLTVMTTLIVALSLF